MEYVVKLWGREFREYLISAENLISAETLKTKYQQKYWLYCHD